MGDVLVVEGSVNVKAAMEKLRAALEESAKQHVVVGDAFREDVQKATTNFIESLKDRKAIRGGGCTTHTIVKVDIEMPPQRGVRTRDKVYRAVCTVDPEGAPYIMVLKGKTHRKAKAFLRHAKDAVGTLVNYMTFTPVRPLEYIELKVHVEDTRDNGSPRNGQELDAATPASAG